MGIPLNDIGGAWSLIHNESQVSMPERICDYYAPTYIAIGPMGVRMWPEWADLFVDELTKLYGIPQEAVLGGAKPRCRSSGRRSRTSTSGRRNA
jgi:hypothetical protein